MMRTVFLAFALILVSVSTAPAAEFEDHPLISRYPDSTLPRKETSDFDEYQLIVGPTIERDTVISQTVSGTTTHLSYRNPPDRSTLEIFSNYADALRGAGLQSLFECTGRGECGQYSGSRWTQFNGMRNIPNDEARYLAGVLPSPQGQIFIALNVQQRNTQIVIVETNEMDTGLVTVSAESLGNDMDTYGRVTVPGIFFEFDAARLTPQSEHSLSEIARLLFARDNLTVWIVGHTDASGDYSHNVDLSMRRAQTVVLDLVRRGVDKKRLTAAGVGPLAPVAPNSTERGREQNRRVEMVRQP
jgi:outer membrane protein OmpA-like peptidoglycan-associated protein